MDYLPRLVDGPIDALLAELPAIFLTGPRATGKTTTAARRAATIVRLDREAEAVAVRADPDAALRGLREPILLDEWHVVPGVLGAVKRAVDVDPRPGRFLITGSVRGDFDGELWPGTGRLTRVPMFGMTVREQAGLGGGVPFLDRAVAGADLFPAADTPDLRGYVERALRGGFPEPALRLGETARRAWLESYVEHLLTRDAEQVDGGRDPVRLRRYLEAYALNTAGIVDERTLFEAAGINRRTAQAYERLLAALLVVDALPAWTSNRLKRLVLMPKRHLVDPALAGAVLGLDTNLVLREGDLLGRLLDTFVVSQLRAELGVSAARPRLYHVRQQQGRLEVDLIAELAGGRLVAIEVKADAAPGPTAPATWPGSATDTTSPSSPGSCSTPARAPTASATGSSPRRSRRSGADPVAVYSGVTGMLADPLTRIRNVAASPASGPRGPDRRGPRAHRVRRAPASGTASRDCNTIGVATSLGPNNRSVRTTLGRVEDLRLETVTGRVGHSTRAPAIEPGPRRSPTRGP